MNESGPLRADGQGGPSPSELGWMLGVLSLIAVGLILRLTTLPSTPDSEDSVLFIRGVIRFSVAESRPHWPGYPVYIGIGKVTAAILGDPVRALHLVSSISSALMAWPLASIARAWAISLECLPARAVWAGWAAGALWLATPSSWVIGSQIFSDPLGLLLGITMLSMCVRAERIGTIGLWIVAGVVAGIMIGVRPNNVTMTGPLLWAAWRRRRQTWSGIPVGPAILAALLAGVGPWLAWMVSHDPTGLAIATRITLGGHFTYWGKSLWTDPEPLVRPLRALRGLALYGLGVDASGRGGTARIVAGIGWVAMLAQTTRVIRSRKGGTYVGRLVAVWAVPHLGYVFAIHDVVTGYPRYMLSAVALLTLWGGLAVAGRGHAGTLAVVVAMVSTAGASRELALINRRQHGPALYAAALFLGGQPRAAVIADPSTALLPFYLYDIAPTLPVIVLAPGDPVPALSRWKADGRTIFATVPPAQDPDGWQPAAHFCRHRLIDPRPPQEVWLFSRGGVPAGGIPLQDCDAVH